MQLHLVVASDKFMGLPKPYQASLRAAAALANGSVRPKYDAANPGAVKRLVVGGAQLRLFSQETLEACFRTATELYGQLSAQNANFKTIAELVYGVPGGRVSLVAGGGILVQQLHDPRAASQELNWRFAAKRQRGILRSPIDN